jgi:tetraacyldisaccharide 4'-kinase
VPRPFVISVGNLAMGGRGKTPVVALLARRLVEAGHRPAILSRGYRRRRPEDGVVIVSDGVRLCADLDRAGDEPLLLARLVPGAAVLVCDVRTLAAAVAERVVGATVLLLDDGFQHRAMRRDLDIVIVAPGDLYERRLPFGRLRSPVSAIARADTVIVDGLASDETIAAIRRRWPADGHPLFSLHRQLGAPAWIDGDPTELLPGPGGSPVLAVAGISGPARFTRSLEAAGYRVTRTLGFRDHHAYDRRDVERMKRTMEQSGARAIVTTAKDAVRLLPLRPLGVPVASVPLEVSIEPASLFQAWFAGRIPEVRG